MTQEQPARKIEGGIQVGEGGPSETEPIGTRALLVQAASEQRFAQFIFIYLFISKERQITRGNKY